MSGNYRWDDLEIFLVTARLGTLAGAASKLGVNSSTIHRRISDLEGQLKTRLFDRSQRGYSLTPVGEELLKHAVAIEEEVLAAARTVSGRDQALEGDVQVSTISDIAVLVLPSVIRGFRSLHPGVTLQVSAELGLADLTRRQADVALRIIPKPRSSDLIPKFIAKVEVGLYASAAYLEQHPALESVDDIRDHYIVRGDEHMAHLLMEEFIERYADPSKIAIRSGSMQARAAAISEGLGIGCLAYFLGDSTPGLRRIDIELPDMSSALWLLVHTDMRRNARVRAFVDFAFERLCEMRPLFEGTTPAKSHPPKRRS